MTQKRKKKIYHFIAILLSLILLCVTPAWNAQIPAYTFSITAHAAEGDDVPEADVESQSTKTTEPLEVNEQAEVMQANDKTASDKTQMSETTETDTDIALATPTQEHREEEQAFSQTQEQEEEKGEFSETQEQEEDKSEPLQEQEHSTVEIESATETISEINDKNADIKAAADNVIMTFCGTEITGATSGDSWTYDRQSQTDTLTLDNFHLADTKVNFIRTNDSNDLIIYLKGDNTVETSGGFYSGLPYPETLTITGEAGATLSFKSIGSGGFFMPQNLIIKDGVRVNFDTTSHVWPNRDLTIDNAELNVQCNGEVSYLYLNQGSLIVKNHSKLTVTNTTPNAVCGIYMHQNMTITDSTVTVTNPNPKGLCIYMKYTTSNPPNPPVTHNATITNSTLEMNGGLLGMHCDKAEIKNSTIKTGNEYVYAIRAAIDEVKIDEDSTVADTMLSYYKSDTMHKKYVVYGNARLPQSFTIAESETLTIPEGAALTLPEGVILTNNGTINIDSPKSLKGSGTLSGDGAFKMDMNADAITVPDDLYWQEGIKEKIKDIITVPETIPVCGKDFSVDYNETDWTTDYDWSADELTCTVKYTRQSDNTTLSKEITIAKAAMVLTEKVNTYKADGTTPADTFAYGDTITVKATPAYQADDSGKTKTTKAKMADSPQLRLRTFASPTAGEMAVFYGDTQLSAPATADSSGTYTMQADTTLLPNDSLNDLLNKKKPFTVKFIGTETMTDAQADFDVTITADAKITLPDKTIRYAGKLPDAFAAENNGATITLLRDVEGTVESGKFAFLDLPIQSDQTGNSFTLELNGHTISSNATAIYIGTGENLTITGSGTITGGNCGIYVVGTADIQGGTISGRNTGIYVQDATSLKISGNVEVRGDGYGLYIWGANADIALSGGTYTSNSTGIYWEARQDTPLNLLDLLDNTKNEKYAYFRGNQPITEGLKSIAFGTLQMAPLNKTVTINPCTDHVWSVEHITNTGTHNQTCKACALTETDIPCTYDYTGDEITQTGTCVCGATVEITLNGAQGLVYDKTPHTPAVTVTRDGKELTASDDYTLKYTDNTNAGTASVTIKGTSDKNTGNIEKTMQFPIAPKPVTITNVTAQEREYDKTDTVQITAVTLAGVITGDAVAVTIPAGGLTGTLESPDAGHYTAVALPENLTLSGTAKDNYTLTQPAGAVKTDVTIRKAKGTLQITDTSVIKTYGDADFRLDYTTESDGEITYQITDSRDTTGTPITDTSVINITADGTISIQNAGTATITLSLAEGRNYTKAEEDTTVQITVNKAAKPQTLPTETMTVSESRKTVGDVPLPENWQWQDTEKEKILVVGTSVTATAVYIGADKDNYEITTQTITITKINCAHTDTELRDALQPDCEHDGYSGDTYCKACGDKIKEGETLPTLGHDYDEGEVTKEPTEETEGEKTYTCLRCGHTYTEPIPTKKPEETHKGLWISGLQHSVPYTGSAVTQDSIKVYHNSTLLQEKTEYTISYKNNKNAGTAQLTVSGKGNYKGKATQTFIIERIDLGKEPQNAVSATVSTAIATGKKLKPQVTVTWNGKKLKEKKDYTLSYDANITAASADGYDITISGTGNYMGSIMRKFHVKPKGTPLLNSTKVTGLAKSYPYQDTKQNAEPNTKLEADLANLTVKVGKTTLTQGKDYTVRTENTDAVGTATLIIEPTQASVYAGEKRIPISITGTDLKKCSITGLEKSYPYTGAPITPSIAVFTGKNGTGKQIPADAYTACYTNNTKPGKAAITITGNPKKGYSGTLKATYVIGRFDLLAGEDNGESTVTIQLPAAAPYAKGGAKPKPVITHTYNGTAHTLRENIDYRLKYKNNTAVYPESNTKQPVVIISGIGNYSGTVTKTYSIGRQNLNFLTIAVTDKPYNAKKKGSAYYSAPKVYDLDGRQLKQNADYTVRYTDAATDQEIGKKDTVANGIEIRVTVTATEKSGYSGTLSATYFVRDADSVKDLAKTKADKIAPQPYTGEPIRPEVRLYTTTGNTKTYLIEGRDYEVIGCYNNTEKGTALILIKGSPKGGYSGIKTLTFKITAADNNVIWSGAF